MPRIRVELLSEGMTVAADVKNIDGMLLVPKGATLGERQIGILQAWGVADVEVEDGEGVTDPSDVLSQLAPAALARLQDEVKAAFWEVDETSPVFAEVFRLLLVRRARRILGV